MAENSEQGCECRCPCAPQVEELALPGAPLPATAIAAAPAQADGAVAVRLQGVRVLTDSVRPLETLLATRPGLPEESGLEDFEDPADLFLRALAPGERDALGLSGGGTLWRPGPGGEQGAGPGRIERTDAGVFGSAQGSAARAARGGGDDEDEGRSAGPAGQYKGIRRSEEQDKRLRTAAQIAESERETIAKRAALSPGGKAAVAAAKAGRARLGAGAAATQRTAEGVRKKTASALARAGISEDLPEGPGAAAPGALADSGPFAGEIDTGAQKGSEAYVQAGRAAAQRLRQSGKSELADRRRLEERKKRIERVTGGGAGGSAARPAAPAAATIAARSEHEGNDTGIDRAAAARSPSTALPTATIRARSQGDAPPASPGGNAPRTVPAAPAAPAVRATIAATTTPLGSAGWSARAAGSAASIPSPAALRAGEGGAAIDLGAFAGTGDVVRVGGGGVRAVPEREAADYAVSTFGGDAFEVGLGAAAGMSRPKKGASPRDSVAAAAAAFAGAVKGAADSFKRYGGGDWIDDLPLVGRAGSIADTFIRSDVVGGLIGKWRAAIGALRAWIDSQSPFQVVDTRGNVVAQGARDPEKYARARKTLITSLTTSIRQALIAAWKRNGKKGPKPTSDEARKIAEDLVYEAEAPPQEDGARSGPIGAGFGRGTDPCAEERKKCGESCGCECVCAPAPGDDGDDDPFPARDPSVRGLRLDTEPVTFAGPPRPFDAGWGMQVAEPDDDSTWGDDDVLGLVSPGAALATTLERIDRAREILDAAWESGDDEAAARADDDLTDLLVEADSWALLEAVRVALGSDALPDEIVALLQSDAELQRLLRAKRALRDAADDLALIIRLASSGILQFPEAALESMRIQSDSDALEHDGIAIELLLLVADRLDSLPARLLRRPRSLRERARYAMRGYDGRAAVERLRAAARAKLSGLLTTASALEIRQMALQQRTGLLPSDDAGTVVPWAFDHMRRATAGARVQELVARMARARGDGWGAGRLSRNVTRRDPTTAFALSLFNASREPPPPESRSWTDVASGVLQSVGAALVDPTTAAPFIFAPLEYREDLDRAILNDVIEAAWGDIDGTGRIRPQSAAMQRLLAEGREMNARRRRMEHPLWLPRDYEALAGEMAEKPLNEWKPRWLGYFATAIAGRRVEGRSARGRAFVRESLVMAAAWTVAAGVLARAGKAAISAATRRVRVLLRAGRPAAARRALLRMALEHAPQAGARVRVPVQEGGAAETAISRASPLRGRHHTSPESLSGIRSMQAINPARGDPVGVHVEVGPGFGPARTASAETGAAGRGAYVELDLTRPMKPTFVGPRDTAVIPTDVPLPLKNSNPRFVRLTWWQFWIR